MNSLLILPIAYCLLLETMQRRSFRTAVSLSSSSSILSSFQALNLSLLRCLHLSETSGGIKVRACSNGVLPLNLFHMKSCVSTMHMNSKRYQHLRLTFFSFRFPFFCNKFWTALTSPKKQAQCRGELPNCIDVNRY